MGLSGLWVIVLCMGAGVLLRASRKLPTNAASVLNSYVIHVPLPALIVWKMHEMLRGPGGSRSVWIPVSMAWIQFGLATFSALALGKVLNWKRPTIGAWILAAGLGNTSFVGYPLLEAIYGPSVLPIGILTDQPGSFLVFSTLGVLTAAIFSGEVVYSSRIFRKILLFPPLVALVLSLLLMPWDFPAWLPMVLEKVSSSLVPVALVSVGLQLRPKKAAILDNWAALSTGLAFKLWVVPCFMTLLYIVGFGEHGITSQVTIVESAMAPMISGVILAEEAGLDAELANLMVGIGIPISLLTVPLWAWLLRTL